MPTDDLGIEYDDEVAAMLNDPAANRLGKLLDYREKRKQAELDKERQRVEKERQKQGLFGGLFN